MIRIASIEHQRSNSSVASRFCRWSVFALVSVFMALSSLPSPARASDACTILLCLAGNWRSIEQCVPPVRRLLRDLMLGRSFPVCAFASVPALHIPSLPVDPNGLIPPTLPTALTGPAGTQATMRWTDGTFCPVQYRTVVEEEHGSTTVCNYAGAIEVTLGGQLWNRTWWNLAGDSVTEWTPAARRALPQTASDDRFDRDYEAWLELQRRNAELQQQQTRTDMGDGE